MALVKEASMAVLQECPRTLSHDFFVQYPIS